ncbi:MAG: hypothetical protein IT385_22205 [Deltaproteobacteria bacterium]|nr:hypothetical protein [Deltaproteobacteria bacterium]
MPHAPSSPRVVMLCLALTSAACQREDPPAAELRPEGPPDVLAVLAMSDGDEEALWCRYVGGALDAHAPGVVEVDGVDTVVCPPSAVDFEPAAASSFGFGLRIMFDELLDADRVETLDCDLDDDGVDDDPLVCEGSLDDTRPLTITCGPGAARLDYTGYYVPNGNRASFPVGPSIVVVPDADALVFPTGTDCDIHLNDTVVDKSGERVDPSQADIPFRLADLAVIETEPRSGALDPSGAAAFIFNAHLDPTAFDASEVVEVVDDAGQPVEELDVGIGRTHHDADTIVVAPRTTWRPGAYTARIAPGADILEKNGGTYTATTPVEIPFVVAAPEPGSATRCDQAPLAFTPDLPGPAAQVCIDEADACTLHDPAGDDPCEVASLAADVRYLEPLLPAGACSGTIASASAWGWRFVWSSRGGFNGCMRPGPADAEHWIVVERPTGGQRWQVRLRVTGGAAEVLGVAPFTGRFHPFGAHVHCEGAPVTFGEPTSLDGRWAEVCVGSAASGACTIFGDTRLTSEDEGAAGCDQHPPLELWVTAANGPYAYSGPGGTSWTIESTSHGELKNDNLVKDFPSDTDVTVVSAATGGGERWRTVFRYSSSGFTIVSVTRL